MKSGSNGRLISRQEASDYCGVSVVTFDRLVRRSILPPRIRGTKLWDRKAIDHALDKLSGLLPVPAAPTPTPPNDDKPAPAGHWLEQLDGKNKRGESICQ